MSKMEIYLVDDSADHRYLVRTIFNKFLPNYHVRFFQGGKELYEYLILQSAPGFTGRLPGLIILDLKMPTIDGYEMLKLLRQTPDNSNTRWKTLPIVILTSNSTDRDISKCYLAGANSFFIKPVEFEDLRYLLETVCHYWMDFNKLPSVTSMQASDPAL